MSKERQGEITRMCLESHRESFLAITILVDIILKENDDETGEQCPATVDAIARGIQALADQHLLYADGIKS